MDGNFARRIFERVPSSIKVKFYCGDAEYCGTATNLSENGMFITVKEMFFPFSSQFELSVLLKDEVLKMHARVNRVMKSIDLYNGISVELINPPRHYLNFVETLRSASLQPDKPPLPEY